MLEDLGFIPPKQARTCAVRTLMNKLDEKDQLIFAHALAEPEWPAKALARELSSRGLSISDTPILKHRKGECSC